MQFSLFSLIFLFVFHIASIVKAVTISTSIPGLQSTGGPAPCGIVFGFYNFALMIGGVLAFAAITYGGVKYTLAAGNPSGQSEAKDWVKGAIYGLILLAGTYLILHVVNPDLTNCGLVTLTPVTTTQTTVGNICTGVLTCGGGDGTCDGACPLDSNGNTQVCRLVTGSLQKQCITSAAGVACGGAFNGSCSSGKTCTPSSGFPTIYSCQTTPTGPFTCGVPSTNYGTCAPVGGGGLCGGCVNNGGATPATARYSCNGTPHPCP